MGYQIFRETLFEFGLEALILHGGSHKQQLFVGNPALYGGLQLKNQWRFTNCDCR